MRYPITVEKTGNVFFVSFQDIPEALTEGQTMEEALEMAKDALETALEFYFEDERTVPMPSAPIEGQNVVELNASLWAKVLLLNAMVTEHVRPVDLARKLEVKPQDVTRLLRLRHPSKIDSIANALHAIGKTLELVVH
jgi:antitoxin HicB